ncbi:hypothetical protein [Psychromarinibacter halotolerans]|uniref:Uncharacterized protein n=1 Tax=Psychromarinibacter halotolerans TaxID=1775175 RepID=A0ABV7GPW1_9RHOB|nr:hypothetical protein [Psychromarinibacter halotolerans]MAQ81640.1 hypothetical protein [Maritimibacter sp.]MDF0595977.1 hypothetical protein [Psychromarinibacter halotolerans]
MEKSLLQKAREGRIAALATLASTKVDNIFLIEDKRASQPRKAPALTFASARSAAPANVVFAPERRAA